MPLKGATVSEQRQRFIKDYLLNFYLNNNSGEKQ